ncbi:type III-B CRISPR-associated protein Cas10/Cmr2 [Melaminivora sp.]
MQTLRYLLAFQTPAFLGNASQQAQWRTPPIKALLRQWWRVAVAQELGYDVARLRQREAALFGTAADEGDSRQSRIRIRLSHWDMGQLKTWNGLEQGAVHHPETERTGYKVGPHAYLGFGPLDGRGGTQFAKKENAAIQAGASATLSLAFPQENAAHIQTALRLMDRYGTLGGRSRNGWGSFSLLPADAQTAAFEGEPATRTTHNWQQALQLDWPHALGSDARGLLAWQTRPFDNWPGLMQELARLKIGLRTQFVLPKARPDGQIHQRHWLAYPVTHHSVSAWGGNARLPNSLRLKVRPAPGNPQQVVGVIFHMPCLPPPVLQPQRASHHRRLAEGTWLSGRIPAPDPHCRLSPDMTTNDILWQTKLHARLHDPAEKALVLLRDPAGHEGGNSRVLWRMARHDMLPAQDSMDNDNADVLHAVAFSGGIKPATYKTVQRADWWAAAADRPQWPVEEWPDKQGVMHIVNWAQVRWAKEPVLIHPLTGATFQLPGGLSETDFEDIKARAFSHLSTLLIRSDGVTDFKKTLLALWRFGPELSEETDNGKLGELWKLLPADTRVPDHSIWDHLDLTSAFAGAFAADPGGQAALLTLSIGPVQPFIASARKMEDLWAGSHLLARLSWEAMRVVCERLGPDAILFPRLRGVPQVDLWLKDQGLPAELFKGCDWMHGSTDSNPLFSAALPNRFVAIVPASQARELAEAVQTQVRQWLQNLGEQVIAELLDEAGIANTPGLPCHAQMRAQLAGFPEVHWAAVPFSLIGVADAPKQTGLDTTELSQAMRPFFGAGEGQDCGFLATDAWKLLQNQLQWQEGGKKSVFFTPNPGVLYPAVHELAERALAAAKSLRPFGQQRHEGWRCSLSGEAEWLTTDRAQLALSTGKRRSRSDKRFVDSEHQETLWTKVADAKPAWAKKGEHLAALPAIKRLWPTLFAKEVGKALNDKTIGRFIVSTHTMALAQQLDQWVAQQGQCSAALLRRLERHEKELGRVALPRRLMRHAHDADTAAALRQAALLPALLDWASEDSVNDTEAGLIRAAVRETLASARANQGDERLETYYGLLLLDGDRMGQWLSGENAIAYRDSFHPQVQKGFDDHAKGQPQIARYGQQPRALSPGRHQAISGALNDFSLTVVRHVVENEHLGRLIYAGGDDVFAMLPVADLLPAMQRLRHAYEGHDPAHQGGRDPRGLTLHKGFALLRGQLMRMMGTRASASCGAVIAHHQAPLSAVRRELATAEQRAKNEGGRDAFSITIIKRSGGALRLTAKWGEPVALLQALQAFLAHPDVSRRAAYHCLQWLDDHALPQPVPADMLQSLLAYQLDRQAGGTARAAAPELARRLATLALAQEKSIAWLRHFISVAEFLAREVRHPGAAA